MRSKSPKSEVNPVIVLMGVSGSGKTTVGHALASELKCPFFDGDDFHTSANVAKMEQGVPLTDADRTSWLERLSRIIHKHLKAEVSAVLACSALKRQYRQKLRQGKPGVQFYFLNGGFDLIWSRMKSRQGHYMKAEMLISQFDTLEAPEPSEAIEITIEADVDTIVKEIMSTLPK